MTSGRPAILQVGAHEPGGRDAAIVRCRGRQRQPHGGLESASEHGGRMEPPARLRHSALHGHAGPRRCWQYASSGSAGRVARQLGRVWWILGPMTKRQARLDKRLPGSLSAPDK